MLCNICPRQCNIDRATHLGFCGVGSCVRVARAALHQWEEPCISFKNGSGTVFFSGCNMKCVYCQNFDISQDGFGKDITIDELAQIFLQLSHKGADNINLVTPTHYIKEIIKAIEISKKSGLTLPIIYNTSSYEERESIKLLKGTVDVYLADFKYMNDKYAQRYSFAQNYPHCAREAIDEMIAQIGNVSFSDDGRIEKGVIVRILLLPNMLCDAKDIVKYLYLKYKDMIYFSLMSQYTPSKNLDLYPEINRKIYQSEYDELVDYAWNLGVRQAFVQEGDCASESFIPKFNLEGV